MRRILRARLNGKARLVSKGRKQKEVDALGWRKLHFPKSD